MSIEERLRAALGVEVVETTRLSGGCIADTERARLADGRSVVVKQAANGLPQEANGLRELAATNTLRVPVVLHEEADLLVLELIRTGPAGPEFMARFGRAFADLHRHRADRFGFYEDNWIGANPQKNTPGEDEWATFYWTHRLEPQTRMAVAKGYDLRADMSVLEHRLPQLLAGSEEPPSLLHGDLWNGNFLCDAQGQAVLIDPAVYYGHREADLGMTHLFGGFTPAFYAAYEEAFPLPPGAEERIPLYTLYHVLNHLNLFGSSYLGAAQRILRSYR